MRWVSIGVGHFVRDLPGSWRWVSIGVEYFVPDLRGSGIGALCPTDLAAMAASLKIASHALACLSKPSLLHLTSALFALLCRLVHRSSGKPCGFAVDAPCSVTDCVGITLILRCFSKTLSVHQKALASPHSSYYH